ncbi:MAG: type IV secretion system DNA-binding domain-containing protein [Solirubrobacteraceae bacterium]
MESSTGFPEAEMKPLLPLHEAWHWLLGAGEHLAIGLALGWLGLWALRAVRLRWTWGPVGIAVAALAPGVVGTLGWPVAIAGVVVTRLGRRREREDVAPADQIGVKPRGPVALAGLMGRLAVRYWRARGGRWFIDDALLVGYDADMRAAEVPIQSHAGGAHTLVVGAAGSGKTVTQTWLSVHAIEAGMPAVVIDPKGDPDLAEHLRAAARRARKPFFEWSPEGPCVYNPYAAGSDGEIADKALAGERFTEPHYLRQAQRFLGREVRVLRRAGVQISIASLAEHLDPDRLEQVLRGMPEGDSAADYEYLDSLSARQRSDLSGVRDRLAILAESDVGRWLDPGTQDASSFGLLRSLQEGAVVLFRLRSDSRPLIMQMLGGAIVLDLLTAASVLQHRRTPSIAVIDEFAALAAPHVGGLFGRARGAGMSLVLGTQEISDMELPGRENLLKQVTGNLTSTISHRQVNPESADWVARLSGKRPVWSTTISSQGSFTYRPEEKPRIAPERVRALEPGQAAVIVHDGPTKGIAVVRMLSVARHS